MILINRILHSDNGTLKDYSVEGNNFKSVPFDLPIVAAEDYLYLGSDLPFNHRWIEMDTVNTVTSVATIELWDGDAWLPAVDVVDQTNGLKNSGIISFKLDKDESWISEDTKDDANIIIGLDSVTIYDLYWMRIKWSVNLDAGTKIKYIGHKFSDETDLSIHYPTLSSSNAMSQFQSGKTDWKEQEFAAAGEITRVLKARNIAVSPNQILNWEIFNVASIRKIAEIIYNEYGSDFLDDKKEARQYFKEAIDQSILYIDKNLNTRIDKDEGLNTQVGNLYR